MTSTTRRKFVLGAAAGFVAASCASAPAKSPDDDRDEDEGEVAPPEDLMREHGVLNRVLLLYDECGRRLDARAPLPMDALARGADVIHRFIEGYHEKLEEDFLFPRFEQAKLHVDLVATLRRQHQAGRTLTETILALAVPATADRDDDRRRLQDALRAFNRMYRPHEAREDTVLFPALRSVVTKKEFAELGERFEDEEHRRFGKAGFEGIVADVATIEQALGVYDLNQFTPT